VHIKNIVPKGEKTRLPVLGTCMSTCFSHTATLRCRQDHRQHKWPGVWYQCPVGQHLTHGTRHKGIRTPHRTAHDSR